MRFDAIQTGRDDVALLGFTSGTTGMPKATMHFHRDLLAVADGYAKILQVTEKDVVVGSPPLAFTFGLGGLAIFPLRFGASAALIESQSSQSRSAYRAAQSDHRVYHRLRTGRCWVSGRTVDVCLAQSRGLSRKICRRRCIKIG